MFSRISQLSKNISEEVGRGSEGSENEKGSPRLAGDIGSPFEKKRVRDDTDMSGSEKGTPAPDELVPNTNVKMSDLPPEIRSRLRKFLKYEEKYPILLETYKAEKLKRDEALKMEKVLMENTPISSLSDSENLAEFLSGINTKTAMLNDELRRVSGNLGVFERERDQLRQEMESMKEERERELKDGVPKTAEDSSLEKELQEKVCALQHKLSNNDKLLTMFKKRVTDLQKSEEDTSKDDTVQKYQEDLRKSNEALIAKSEQVEELENSLADLEISRNSLLERSKETDSLKTRLADFEVSQENFQTEEAKIKTDLEKCQKDLNDKSIAVESLERRVAELSAAKEESENTELESLLEISNQTLKSKTEEVENLREMLKEVGNDLVTARDELKEQKSVPAEQLKCLQEKLESAFEEVQKQKTIVEEREKEISSLKDKETNSKLERASLQHEIASKNRKISHLEEEITGQNEKISNLQRENGKIAEVSSVNKKLMEDKNASVSALEQTKQEYNNLMHRLNKVTTENNRLVKGIEELQDKYNDTVSARAAWSSQVDNYKQQFEEVSLRMKEAESKSDLVVQELNEARRMLQERNREMSTMRKVLLDAEKSQDGPIKELNSKVKHLEEEKEWLENQSVFKSKKKQREIDSLQEKVDELTASIERTKSETVKQKEPVDVNHEEVTTIVEGLRESLNKSESKVNELASINQTLRTINEESSLKFERLNKKYRMLSDKVNFEKTPEPTVEPREKVDHTGVAYTKNVLLGFLEHKDQRQQLLPVVKALLELDKSDEERFLNALKVV